MFVVNGYVHVVFAELGHLELFKRALHGHGAVLEGLQGGLSTVHASQDSVVWSPLYTWFVHFIYYTDINVREDLEILKHITVDSETRLLI